MEALRFRQSLQVEIIDNTRLFLLSDAKSLIIDNAVTARVAGLVDGRRTSADIVVELARDLAPTVVFSELDKLRRAGHLVDTRACEDQAGIYVEGWGSATDGFAERAAQMSIVVSSLGDRLAAGAIEDALGRLGCAVTPLDGLPDVSTQGLVVVVVDDYLTESLREFNQARQRSGQPWMLVKPWGRELWVGPRFVPGETGCWECLADRLTAN